MKTKHLFALLVTLLLSGCDRKTAAIQNELHIIGKTAKDTDQPEYIRKSAVTFGKIIKSDDHVTKRDWIEANGDIMKLRNETTISTHVAFLKALEKMIPNELPSPEQYDSQMDYISRKAEIIESNVSWSVVMMSECIKEIPLYNDPVADEAVSGVLKRLGEKHGTSDTGKKILEFLNMVHKQGLTARSWGIKPWESPKTPRTL